MADNQLIYGKIIPRMTTTTDNCLAESGLLSEKLDDFQPRYAQQQMGAAIEASIAANTHLLCEAPTGTGKTFAYLVPALLASHKTLISTGTKNLQDQLFHRDLPRLRAFLGSGKRVALLKGRSNYLCVHRLEQALSQGFFYDRVMISQLRVVEAWAQETQTGDNAECPSLAEDAPIWTHVTSTADNCLGQECPLIGRCFVLKARRKALEADIVVVNHHLLFADQVVKEDGFGELLPDAHTIICDEAHQVPEIAAHFLSETVSTRQIQLLVNDTENEIMRDAPDMADLLALGEKLIDEALAVRQVIPKMMSKGTWQELARVVGIHEVLQRCTQAFVEYIEQLTEAAVRGKGLAHCHQRALQLLNQWKRLTEQETSAEAALTQDAIHWFECFSRSIVFHLTPIAVKHFFERYMQTNKQHWVFTSATLSTNQHFDFFKANLGLPTEVKSLILPSPFNYEEQALLYVPRYLPDCHAPHYAEACVNAALPLINRLQGRTFFLFTSHKALTEAAQILSTKTSLPLFVQGDVSRIELIHQFCRAGNGILLGTTSFWEGIDIKGPLLSCVIIDRLPFASPGDPVNKARIEAFRKRGEDPFTESQLPKAVLMLKQGAGRLIRDEQDKGVLMVCDQRIVSKAYGEIFLNSLPQLRKTREIEVVEQFLETIELYRGDELK